MVLATVSINDQQVNPTAAEAYIYIQVFRRGRGLGACGIQKGDGVGGMVIGERGRGVIHDFKSRGSYLNSSYMIELRIYIFKG